MARLEIFGRARVIRDSGTDELPAARDGRAQLLLAMLTLDPEGRIAKNDVHDALWPGTSRSSVRGQESAAGRLNRTVSTARDFLGRAPDPIRGAITTPGMEVRLNAPDATGQLQTDAEDLRDAIESGDHDALGRALDLVRGDVLSGLSIPGHTPVDDTILARIREDGRDLCREAVALRADGSRDDTDLWTNEFFEAPSGTLLAHVDRRIAAPSQARSASSDDGDKSRAWRRRWPWPTAMAVAVGAVVALMVATRDDGTSNEFPHPNGQTTITAPRRQPTIFPGVGRQAYVSNIRASLAVVNDTLKTAPRRRVKVEANDAIRFILSLTNPTKWRTQALLVTFACTAFCSPGQSGGLKMTAILSDTDGRRVVTPRPVVLEDDGSGEKFSVSDIPAQRVSGVGQSSVPAPLDGQPQVTASEGQSVGEFQFGELSPHEVGSLEFRATWKIDPEAQLAGGGTMFFRDSAGDWSPSRVSLTDGQRATVAILLHGSEYPSVPLVNVTLTPRPDRGIVIVQGHAKLPRSVGIGGTTDYDLSMGRAYSEGGGPIQLKVVPGTTLLRRGYRKTTCTKTGIVTRLPDGIAQDGIKIGPIGGFKPRDRCYGREFLRYVEFEIVASIE
jgi:hypothetical protein